VGVTAQGLMGILRVRAEDLQLMLHAERNWFAPLQLVFEWVIQT
jgi:hypothetical protein